MSIASIAPPEEPFHRGATTGAAGPEEGQRPDLNQPGATPQASGPTTETQGLKVRAKLFESGLQLADLSVEAFIKLLGQTGVPAVSYSPEELVEELEIAR
jgi:hypothetical protein